MWFSFLAIMLAATLILFAFTRLVAERLMNQHHGQKKDFFTAANHNILNDGINEK